MLKYLLSLEQQIMFTIYWWDETPLFEEKAEIL